MTKMIIAACIATFCASAWACRTYTIFRGDRIIMCTECCIGSNCTVQCF